MRFMVDESAGMAVVEYLRSRSPDVFSVAETMLHDDDLNILDLAACERRILVVATESRVRVRPLRALL